MYYIGIDGSSSFTRLIGANDTGKTLARHAGGSIRLQDNEPEIAKVALSKLINEYNQLIGEKRTSCGGIAIGLSHNDDLEKYRELCKSINIDIPIYVGYHLELVMCSATRLPSGLVLQAHNTSFGFCKNIRGEINYTGRFGRGIDDGGSSFWIGRRAIRSALMTLDGRRNVTSLTQRIKNHFNVENTEDLLQFTTDDAKYETLICDAAIIVKDCAEIEDVTAIEIEDAAAYELYQLAHGMIIRNDLRTGDIVAYGSVFSVNQSILNKTATIINSVYPDVRLIYANEKPEVGGVYLAQLLNSSEIIPITQIPEEAVILPNLNKPVPEKPKPPENNGDLLTTQNQVLQNTQKQNENAVAEAFQNTQNQNAVAQAFNTQVEQIQQNPQTQQVLQNQDVQQVPQTQQVLQNQDVQQAQQVPQNQEFQQAQQVPQNQDVQQAQPPQGVEQVQEVPQNQEDILQALQGISFGNSSMPEQSPVVLPSSNDPNDIMQALQSVSSSKRPSQEEIMQALNSPTQTETPQQQSQQVQPQLQPQQTDLFNPDFGQMGGNQFSGQQKSQINNALSAINPPKMQESPQNSNQMQGQFQDNSQMQSQMPTSFDAISDDDAKKMQIMEALKIMEAEGNEIQTVKVTKNKLGKGLKLPFNKK